MDFFSRLHGFAQIQRASARDVLQVKVNSRKSMMHANNSVKSINRNTSLSVREQRYISLVAEQ